MNVLVTLGIVSVLLGAFVGMLSVLAPTLPAPIVSGITLFTGKFLGLSDWLPVAGIIVILKAVIVFEIVFILWDVGVWILNRLKAS